MPAVPFRAQSISFEFMISLDVFGAFLSADLSAVQRRKDYAVENIVEVDGVLVSEANIGPDFGLPFCSRYASRIPASAGMTGIGAFDRRFFGSFVKPSQTERLTMITSPS